MLILRRPNATALSWTIRPRTSVNDARRNSNICMHTVYVYVCIIRAQAGGEAASPNANAGSITRGGVIPGGGHAMSLLALGPYS